MSVNHYYIATTGSNSNSGTTANAPWSTFAHADASLILGSDGTVVHVANGTYAETITTNQSGTAVARIRYTSDTPYGARLIGTTSTPVIWSMYGSYSDVVGFDFDGIAHSSIFTALIAYTTDILVQGNKMHDIGFLGGVTQYAVTGSFSPNNSAGHGSRFIGNLIYHNNGGAGHITGQGNAQSAISMNAYDTASNNLILDHGSGYAVQVDHGYPTPGGGHFGTSATFTNNTICNVDQGVVLGYVDNVTDFDTISNNIVCNVAGGTQSAIRVHNPPGCGSHEVYANNLLYGSTGYLFDTPGCPDTSHGTQSGSNAATFVNYTGTISGDYHLKVGSTAIGTGTAVNAPDQDFDGVWRSTSSEDIGAFAFTAGVAPPPPPPLPTGLVARVSQVLCEVVGVGISVPAGSGGGTGGSGGGSGDGGGSGSGGSGGAGGTGSEGASPARVSQVVIEAVISSNSIGVPSLACVPPTSSLLPCNEANFVVTASGSIPFPTIDPADIPAFNTVNGFPYDPGNGVGGGVAPAFWNHFEYSPTDDGIYTINVYSDPALIEQFRIYKINRATNTVEWVTPHRVFNPFFPTNATTDSVTNNFSNTGVDSSVPCGIIIQRLVLLHDMCISPDGNFLVTAMSGFEVQAGNPTTQPECAGSYNVTYLEKRSVQDGSLIYTRFISHEKLPGGEVFEGENTNLSGCRNVDDGRLYFGFITEFKSDDTTPIVHIINDNLNDIVRIPYAAGNPNIQFPGNYYGAMDNHGRYWYTFGGNVLLMVDLTGVVTTYTLTEMPSYIINSGTSGPYIYGIIFDPIDNTLLLFDPYQSFTTTTVYDSLALTGSHISSVIYKFDIAKLLSGDPVRLMKAVDWGPCAGSGLYLRPGNRLTVGANKLCTTQGTAVTHDLTDITRLEAAVANSPGGMFLTHDKILTSSLDNTTTNPHRAGVVVVSPNFTNNLLWGTCWMAYVDQGLQSPPEFIVQDSWKWFDMVRVSCPTNLLNCDGIDLGDCGCGGGSPPPPGPIVCPGGPTICGDCWGRSPSSVWEAAVVGGKA